MRSNSPRRCHRQDRKNKKPKVDFYWYPLFTNSQETDYETDLNS